MSSQFITTDATGRCEAMPDLATIEVLTRGEGESASIARSAVEDRVATIKESVTTVTADQITTVDLQVQATSEMFEPETNAPFQGTERLRIECLPETVETVVIEVTDAGGLMENVQFEIPEQSYQELQDEALASAMERAREKAERIAAAEGLTVGDVQEVTSKEVSAGMQSIVDEALMGNPDTGLSPEPIRVSEGVEVVFELIE